MGPDINGQFGWCGTCYGDEPGKPGYCKPHVKTEDLTSENETLDNAASSHNSKEFSRPTGNENWGFCSENCFKLDQSLGHSEVY